MSLKKRSAATSLAKITANQKNALKSTGPQSIVGKRVSRWNSLQHGLLAQAAVIELGDKPEKKEELRRFLGELREQYGPVGAIEEILIEKIAVSYWRLRRCQLAEVGEILMASGSAWETRPNEREMNFYNDVASNRELEGSPYWKFKKSETGLNVLIKLLRKSGQDLSNNKSIGEETEKQLRSALKGTEVIERYMDSTEPIKKRLKYLYEELIPTLEEFKLKQYDQDRLNDVAFMMTSLVPGLRGDLLQRYESTIERQLYRAIGQLERLQRSRMIGYENDNLPNEPND